MKHMTLSEFIDSESDEPVFIVDGPQPMCATTDWATAEFWRQRAALYLALSSEPKLAEHDHPFIQAHQIVN